MALSRNRPFQRINGYLDVERVEQGSISDKRLRVQSAYTLKAAFILTCFIFFGLSLSKPVHNWDILGYAASALSLSESDPEVIHSTVYNLLEYSVSSSTVEELTTVHSYRISMHNDPNAFSQQIPFYKFRIIFVLLVYLLYSFGLDLFEAQHLLSAFFGIAGLLLLFQNLHRQLNPFIWLPVALLFFCLTENLTTLSNAGSDTLAFFWTVLISICYMRNNRFFWLLLPITALIRTDLLIFAGLLLIANAFDRSTWRNVAVCGLASVLFYTMISIWADSYDWQTLIYFVFVSDMSATHPLTYSEFGVGFKEYIGFLLQPEGWLSKWAYLCGICTLITSAVYPALRHSKLFAKSDSQKHQLNALFPGRIVTIAIVSMLYVIIHYLLFPALFMRFFTAPFLLMAISSFTVAGMWWKTTESPRREGQISR